MSPQDRRLPVASEPAPRLFRKLSTGSALTASAFTIAVGLTIATPSAHSIEATANSVPTSTPANRQALPDGIYLYGQSQKADQIGTAYMVFRVTKHQVVGAFYMPSSSFDCFQGELTSEKLALTVIDSYEQTSYPYSVVQVTNTTVAASGQPTVEPASFIGYSQLSALSKNDERMLSACQAKFQ